MIGRGWLDRWPGDASKELHGTSELKLILTENSQPTNGPFNQSTNRLTSQPTNEPFDQAASQATNKIANLPMNYSITN